MPLATKRLPQASGQIVSPSQHVFPRLLSVAGWLLIAANFIYFSAPAVNSHFAPDEMMNMAWAWEAGLPKILRALVEFWSGFYRPTGALYYLTLYHFFGLNPVPFRIFDLALLAFNLYLAYRYAKLLSGSEFVALLSTFVFSYQVSLSIWTTYNGAFAYDRLCFTFYFGALLFYLDARRRGHLPGVLRTGGILILYIFALGAKEMAVTLPVLMLAYECVWHCPRPSAMDLKPWVSRNLLLTAVVGLMTLAFVISKTHGSNAITLNPAYRPTDLTPAHFFHSQAEYINELLFKAQAHQPLPSALLIFASMFALAIAFRDRCLAYSGLHALLTPLPIAFLQRGGGCLYIVYLGWTLYAARLVYRVGWWMADRLSIKFEYRWAPTAVLAVAGLVSLFKANLRHQHFAGPAMLSNGDLTWSAITQLNRLRPSIPSHSTVAYLKTPFKDWDMLFITELWRNDRTVRVVLTEKTPLPPAELARVNTLLGFDADGHLHEFKPTTGQMLPAS